MPTHRKRFFEKRKGSRKTIKHPQSAGWGWFETSSNNQSGKPSLMNYPTCSLQMDGKNIGCDVCSKSKYYIIHVSVNRSKTATIMTDAFLDDDINSIISHPYTSYVCTTCLHSRMVYEPTSWNGLHRRIVEIIPSVDDAPQANPNPTANSVPPV